jgi:hypothetical protein
MVWAKAGDRTKKAANGRNVAVIRSPSPRRQNFAAGKSRIKIAFEGCRRLGALHHDQIVILAFEAGRGKVRGAVRSNLPSIW